MRTVRLQQTSIETPSRQGACHMDLSQFSIVTPELKILSIIEGLKRLRRELDLFESQIEDICAQIKEVTRR
jgi:hypothetical protein